MKKRHALILSCLCLLTVATTEAREVVLGVDKNYPPFSYAENGKAKGIYIRIVQAAFDQIPDYSVQFMPLPWKRAKKMARSGKVLGIFPVFFHGHDWPYLYPYSLAFFEENVQVMCNTDKTFRQWPKDYRGLRIGNLAGFDGFGGEEFRKMIAQNHVQYIEYNTLKQEILALGLKRLDCALVEKTAYEHEIAMAKLTGEYDKYGMSNIRLSQNVSFDKIYIGFSDTNNKVYHYKHDLVRKLNVALWRLDKTGKIKAIAKSSIENPTGPR